MPYIGQKPHNKVVTASEITDGIITADKLASNAVTTAKINADAVTDAKIADDVVGTEHLTAGEVDTTALGADAVTAAKIADNAISEEHLDATIITGLTALAATPADTDELLISDAGTLKRIDYSYIKGELNKPYFEAYTSGLQQTDHNTTTKLTFGTEAHDTNSDFASDRFTPTVAGKYFCYARATTDPASYNNGRDSDLKFYFNGAAENSRFFSNYMAGNTSTSTGSTAMTHHTMGIITFNGSSDYLEVYGRLFVHSGTDSNAQFGKKVFGAFLLSTT